MSNCTGYPFDVSIDLCALNPLGDGNISDLNLSVNTGFMFGNTIIPAWDGKELVIDLIAEAGITVSDFRTNNDRCDIRGAMLTLIPDDNNNMGMALLEITIDNCDGPPMTTSPIFGTSSTTTTPAPEQYVDDSCGGGGTYVLSEMIPISLDPAEGCK